MNKNATDFNIVCLSHLRWDFVYQRPQHLMSRFATQGRVLYVEEPIWDAELPALERTYKDSGVEVIVPHLPRLAEPKLSQVLRNLIDQFLLLQRIDHYCLWYYSPMAYHWTAHLKPQAVIYDCMDELSGFRGAPPELQAREKQLLQAADVVFTGGYSLFEAKRHLHKNIYPFPSSVDVQHFAKARTLFKDPQDQADIPHLRIGYAGVIDERMDLDLLQSVAELRPEWNFVMIGPVVKISESELPRLRNIHYLGMKRYEELPSYFSGWDVGMLPFARNEATRYISPTKTPEYLAAALPVVSTSIRDVVQPYGLSGLVHVADDPAEFVNAVEYALKEDRSQRLGRVDALLASNCWEKTWRRMAELIEDAVVNASESQMVRVASAAAGTAAARTMRLSEIA